MSRSEVPENNDRGSVLTADTDQTDRTESSATTIWGPGTLSGKAIKSLGEASLRGLDSLIIRWKLAKINSDLSKSSAATGDSTFSVDKLERIYDDLLELSRLDFYDGKVRQKALRLIMIQIGSRETNQLISCIMKWPSEEIKIFLSEMMVFMPCLWDRNTRESSHSLSYPELISVYRASQSASEEHEVIPFLGFISQLARYHPIVRQAILSAGYPAFLTDLHQHYDANIVPEVTAAAREALEAFADDLGALERHRLDLVWPRGDSTIPLTRNSLNLTTLTPNRRKITWVTAEGARIRERLCEIQVILEMPVYHQQACRVDLFDLCFDLVTLYRSDSNDRALAELALSLLIRCVAIGGVLGDQLRCALAHSSYEDVLGVFYRITYPLLQMRTELFSTAEDLCQQITAYHPQEDPIDYIVEFAVSLAEAGTHCVEAILDSEIKGVLSNTTVAINRGDVVQRLQNAAAQPQSSTSTYLDQIKKVNTRRRSVTI